jgi:hypothetical protein
MGHLELIALMTLSYLASLWGIERWRRWGRRTSEVSLAVLGRPHLRRALAPVSSAWEALGIQVSDRGRALIDRLETGDVAQARQLWVGLSPGLDDEHNALLEAAIELVAAGIQPSALRRHRSAVRARHASRRARGLGLPAIYLEVLVLLGFLSDSLTADLRLWQSKRLLALAARLAPADPLLQLASAQRSARAGQSAEAIAALARALYHARGDRFVATLIASAPFVEELSPGLVEEARRELEAGPAGDPSA